MNFQSGNRMRRFSSISLSILFLLSLGFCGEHRAYGYVNPGSSLVLFQGASSVIMGTLYYFRRRIGSLLVKRNGSSDEQAAR